MILILVKKSNSTVSDRNLKERSLCFQKPLCHFLAPEDLSETERTRNNAELQR